MDPEIEQFNLSEHPWRIDWLGEILFPGAGYEEPRVLVHLSELQDNYKDALSNGALHASGKHEMVPVKIGLISLLKTGSVWRRGILQPPRIASRSETFHLSPSRLKLFHFGDIVDFEGESFPIISGGGYRVGDTAYKHIGTSWVGVVKKPKPSISLLLIPSTVIFQKCIATSPKAVRRLIYGELNKIIDDDHGFIEDEPNTYYINMYKDFRDQEGKAIANLVADPVARDEFRQFRQSLVASRVNADRARSASSWKGGHLKVGMPFSNDIEFTAIGKLYCIQRGRKKFWCFLATEIVDLSVKLVFDSLVIDRKNPNFKGQNADDAALIESWANQPNEPTNLSEPTQPIDADDDPIRGLEALSLEASGDFEAIGLIEIKERTEVQRYRRGAHSREEVSTHTGEGATGDPHGAGAGAAPLDIPIQQLPKTPVTLEHFLDVLDLLQQKGFAFETIAVTAQNRKAASREDTINFLPFVIKGVRSWHLASNHRGAPPRGYVVAKIFRGGTWHYFIELERKGKEALAIAHFRANTGGAVDTTVLHKFMIDVARENGWSAAKSYTSWIFETIKHRPSQELNVLANVIVSTL